MKLVRRRALPERRVLQTLRARQIRRAAAAARVHAKLLIKHRAGQLLSRACGDEVSEDVMFDQRAAAGLGAVDAL